MAEFERAMLPAAREAAFIARDAGVFLRYKCGISFEGRAAVAYFGGIGRFSTPYRHYFFSALA